MKVGFVITNHYSQKIRPYGRKILVSYLNSIFDNCNHDFKVFVVDNQSDDKFSSDDISLDYTYIEDQWAKGLTGAWNTGIKRAYEDGCDVIINTNDDLVVNKSINSFIEHIQNCEHKDVGFYGPLTNGVNGGFVAVQGSDRINHEMTKEISGLDWNSYLSGFFFGFTKEFYEKFRYSDGDLFAEFDKFKKRYIHEYAGDCGKWGGQEMEQKRFVESGGKIFVIGSCWVDHIKFRDWDKARKIAGEYGWHKKENF